MTSLIDLWLESFLHKSKKPIKVKRNFPKDCHKYLKRKIYRKVMKESSCIQLKYSIKFPYHSLEILKQIDIH